ncbi:glucuronate isomerase [Sphingomonas turrisvirgatae]|uniref:Uronate isomerase n=1 Tax=Sphingomonas turrisvirgatae TaxID=1888892 RepID=A0A1E3LRR2_9SPHN|nr:glucuronate isomerase [Sphingomonas turrisvirgatae]ODP36438.1 glucuronate isomerase [Sphingomonas turrisvirgatae]
MTPYRLHPDRLFPTDPSVRAIARELYEGVRSLPIVSPHGHTDPSWFASNEPFRDPASLFIIPDHYIFRMLYSRGVRLEELGVPRVDGGWTESDPRKIWRRFAKNFHLLRGTPSWMWLGHALHEIMGIPQKLSVETADVIYDQIDAKLKSDDYRPRALFERFNIEVLATTEDPLDDLRHHRAIGASGWHGRVLTAFRPDNVTDPEHPRFASDLRELGRITGEDVGTWEGYLAALRARRRYFIEHGGCTSTDHGHPTAHTENLAQEDAAALFARVSSGQGTADDAERFRGQMLTEMARMSVADGLVMQIHPGALRSQNPAVTDTFGEAKGDDWPSRTEYVKSLKPLLNAFGNERDLTIILFTLDESTYAREIAPLAGHYPALRIGPAWWFHDSPEGMRRFREQVTETGGFYNTVGFNDDTRAFLSIPSRHDMSRRVDCSFLARLVAEHRIDMDEAQVVATDLAYNLVREAYRL